MRVPTMAAALVVAMTVAGCSLFGSEEPSPSPTEPAIPPPPTEHVAFDELYGLTFTDEYRQGLTDEEHQAAELEVQACMADRGWDYVIEENNRWVDPAEGVDDPGERNAIWARHGAETWGFHIVTDVLWNAGYEAPYVETGPNAAYAATLSDADRAQYFEDLDGDVGCYQAYFDYWDDEDPTSFGYAAETLASQHWETMWFENPFAHTFGDGGPDEVDDTTRAFDPLEDQANSTFAACTEQAGFGQYFRPDEFRAAYAGELAPRVEALVGPGASDALYYRYPRALPSELVEPVTALFEIEVETATTIVECQIPWEDTMRELEHEWELGYVADNWEDIWDDLAALRARPDAPAEWLELMEGLFGPAA